MVGAAFKSVGVDLREAPLRLLWWERGPSCSLQLGPAAGPVAQL